MIDDRTGKSFNYTKKRGVIETGCMMRDAGALIDIDRAELWNVAERVEKRKDSRTAREFVMALPYELDHAKRKDIVERFCRHLIDRYGVAVDWAMHAPDRKGDDKNFHAHILMTTRSATITNDGMILLGEKTDLELANKDLKKRGVYTTTQQQIKDLREFCATITNNALKDAKIDASVDHRSHKDRNLKTVPTIKLGFKASALERKGITTERGDINRAIRAFNDALNAPVPAPKPKPAPKPASAPIVHHTPAPTVTNQFIDDFAQAFADELANEPVSFAIPKRIEPVPAPTPAPTPPTPPAQPANKEIDRKHSIQPHNPAPQPLPAHVTLPVFVHHATFDRYADITGVIIGHYNLHNDRSDKPKGLETGKYRNITAIFDTKTGEMVASSLYNEQKGGLWQWTKDEIKMLANRCEQEFLKFRDNPRGYVHDITQRHNVNFHIPEKFANDDTRQFINTSVENNVINNQHKRNNDNDFDR